MDGFGIKLPVKVDMLLNKETKPDIMELNQSTWFMCTHEYVALNMKIHNKLIT